MDNITKIAELQKKYLKEAEELPEVQALRKAYQIELNSLTAGISTKDLPELRTKGLNEYESFVANGQKYIIRKTLNITRYQEFEKLQVEVGYGVEYQTMFANLSKAYGLLQDRLDIDAGVVIHNMLNGIKINLDDRKNPALYICALFICRPDEDLNIIDEEVINSKIEDWQKENIDMNSFFSFAFNLVKIYIPTFNNLSQNTSSQKTTEKTKEVKKGSQKKK